MADAERAEHKKYVFSCFDKPLLHKLITYVEIIVRAHPNYIYRPNYRRNGVVRRRRRKEMDEQHVLEEERRCSVVARVLRDGGPVDGESLENAIKEQEVLDKAEDERRAILGLEPLVRMTTRRAPRSRSVSMAHRSASQRKVSEPMSEIEEQYRQQRAHTVPVPAPLHIDQGNPYLRGVNPVPNTAELLNINFPLQTPQGMYHMDQYINVGGEQAAAVHEGNQYYDHNGSSVNWNGFNELDVNRTLDQSRFMHEGHSMPPGGVAAPTSHGYTPMMAPGSVDENGLQQLSQDGSIHALPAGVEHMSPNGKQAYNYQLQAVQPHHPMSSQPMHMETQLPIDLSQLRVEVYNNVKYVQLPRDKASDAKLVESLRQAGLGISFEATEGEIRAMMSN